MKAQHRKHQSRGLNTANGGRAKTLSMTLGESITTAPDAESDDPRCKECPVGVCTITHAGTMACAVARAQAGAVGDLALV